MKKYTYILLLVALVGCIKEDPIFNEAKYACNSNITNTHPESSRFQTFLEEKVAQGLPGISMLIETPEGIWTGGAGVADIPNDIAMQGCSLHKVGSITKTFTATLILKLYEQGELDLDDPISNHLSSDIVNRIPNGNEVTIRNLLNHASGIPDHLDLEYSLDYFDNPTRVFTALEDISYIYDKSADFLTGTKVEYSNVNYTLLGLIAEHITNKTGTQLYQEMIFGPLGMNTSHFNQNGENPSGLVRGYFDESGNGSFIDITPLKYVAHSMAGGASSTVEDLYTFLQASFTPNAFFSQETIDEMLTLSNIPFGKEDFDFGNENKVNKVNGIALCWFQLDTDFGIAYGHNGGFNGRRARMWYFPDSQNTIIFMYNASGESIDPIEDELFRNEMVELLFE